jgi:hypothetical protein
MRLVVGGGWWVVREQAARALANLCDNHEGNVQLVAAAGGVAALVGVLQVRRVGGSPYPPNPQLGFQRVPTIQQGLQIQPVRERGGAGGRAAGG